MDEAAYRAGETCRALVEPLQTLSYLQFAFSIFSVAIWYDTTNQSKSTFINAILLTLCGMTDDKQHLQTFTNCG
jgi:hypothetical protein